MKRKTPNIVTMAVLTVITLLTWIFFEVYQALITPPPLDIPQEVLAPLTPALNLQSLDRLQQSVFFTDEEISPITIPTIIPTPLPSPTPETIPTEELTPTLSEEEPASSPPPTTPTEEEKKL